MRNKIGLILLITGILIFVIHYINTRKPVPYVFSYVALGQLGSNYRMDYFCKYNGNNIDEAHIAGIHMNEIDKAEEFYKQKCENLVDSIEN